MVMFLLFLHNHCSYFGTMPFACSLCVSLTLWSLIHQCVVEWTDHDCCMIEFHYMDQLQLTSTPTSNQLQLISRMLHFINLCNVAGSNRVWSEINTSPPTFPCLSYPYLTAWIISDATETLLLCRRRESSGIVTSILLLLAVVDRAWMAKRANGQSSGMFGYYGICISWNHCQVWGISDIPSPLDLGYITYGPHLINT